MNKINNSNSHIPGADPCDTGTEVVEIFPEEIEGLGVEYETPECTRRLAAEVHGIIRDLYPDSLSLVCVEHVITEAMFQVAGEIRHGHTAELEFIGTFDKYRQGGVRYEAAAELLATPAHQQEKNQ